MTVSNQPGNKESGETKAAADAPLILAIDTSSRRRSVAVARGRQILSLMAVDAVATHSWELHDEIDLALRKLQVELRQIRAFGVTVGPGSFTGLRIGLAAIKGLAHPLGKPVVGVSSLQALAQMAGVTGLVCASIDASRGEIYSQLFRVNRAGSVEPVTEPTVASAGNVYASLADEPSVTFIGSGVFSSRQVLEEQAAGWGREIILSPPIPRMNEGWLVIQSSQFLAPAVACLTAEALRQGRTLAARELAALYVKPANAEVKRRG